MLTVIALFWTSVAFSQTLNFDEEAASARKTLETFVAKDTTNPPGNESKIARFVAEVLKKEGIPYEITEFEPGRENIVARLKSKGSGEKPVLLLAHIDVVGAEGQHWSTDPHKVTEKKDFLYGRGVGDDLGMAAINLQTFLILKRQKTPLRRDVILALTGDEESGGKGIQYLIKNNKASINSAYALNEGGGVEVDESGKVKMVSLQAAEKMYQDFTISAEGETGHSSVPKKNNAIYRLAKALQRIGEYKFPARLIDVTRRHLKERAKFEKPKIAAAMKALADAQGKFPEWAVNTLDEHPGTASFIRTTCVATLISGGTRENALPASAFANVNCRVLPGETTDDVINTLKKIIQDPKVKVEYAKHFFSSQPSPIGGEVEAAVRKTADSMWPGIPVIPSMSRGATDSRFLRRAGIEAYGIDPIGISEEDTHRMHGIDERIPVHSLRSGIEFMYRLVLELASQR